MLTLAMTIISRKFELKIVYVKEGKMHVHMWMWDSQFFIIPKNVLKRKMASALMYHEIVNENLEKSFLWRFF